MGLIKDVENTGKVAVLTDIQGLEDFLGDMDFKVAGTVAGHHRDSDGHQDQGHRRGILRQALAQAYDGRMHILGKMLEVLPAPREELSTYAPKIITFTINPEKIGEVVGPRGKTINKIIERDRREDRHRGRRQRLYRHARRRGRGQALRRQIIEGHRPRAQGRRRVRRQGRSDHALRRVRRAMLPGKDGMVHISKLDQQAALKRSRTYCNIGDTLLVKVNEIDKQGRVNLIHYGVGEDEFKEDEE